MQISIYCESKKKKIQTTPPYNITKQKYTVLFIKIST